MNFETYIVLATILKNLRNIPEPPESIKQLVDHVDFLRNKIYSGTEDINSEMTDEFLEVSENIRSTAQNYNIKIPKNIQTIMYMIDCMNHRRSIADAERIDTQNVVGG